MRRRLSLFRRISTFQKLRIPFASPHPPFHSPRARLRTIASPRRSPISRLRVLVHIIGTAPLKYAANEPAPLPVQQKHYISIRATERKNRWACAIDSGLLPAIRFSKWRTTNQNNTRHSKGRNAAVLALRTSEFYIIVRHLPSKLWSFS